MQEHSHKLSSAILIILSMVAYLLKYALNVFFANHLPVHVYGDLNIALRLLLIFSTMSLMGTSFSAKRFLAHYLRVQDHENAERYVHWNLRLLKITFLLCLVIALVSIGLVLLLDHFGIREMSNYHLAFYMLWIAPILGGVLLLASYLSSHQFTLLAYSCRQVGRYALLFVCFVASILWLNIPMTTMNIVLIVFVTYFILFMIEMGLLLFIAPWFRSFKLSERPPQKEALQKKWFKFSSRLIANNVVFMIIVVLDLLIVEVFSGSERDVGYYSAALAISSLLWGLTRGVFQRVKVNISYLYTTIYGRILLQKSFREIAVILFFSATFFFVLLMVFSKYLLLMFGQDYSVAHTTVILLLIGTYIGVFSDAPVTLLAYSGQEKLLNQVNGIEISLLLLLGIPLTYFYAIEGAAIAYIISVLAKTAIMVIYSRKRLGIKSLGVF